MDWHGRKKRSSPRHDELPRRLSKSAASALRENKAPNAAADASQRQPRDGPRPPNEELLSFVRDLLVKLGFLAKMPGSVETYYVTEGNLGADGAAAGNASTVANRPSFPRMISWLGMRNVGNKNDTSSKPTPRSSRPRPCSWWWHGRRSSTFASTTTRIFDTGCVWPLCYRPPCGRARRLMTRRSTTRAANRTCRPLRAGRTPSWQTRASKRASGTRENCRNPLGSSSRIWTRLRSKRWSGARAIVTWRAT